MANFASTAAQIAILTATSNAAAMGTVSGGGTYELGTTAILTATAHTGHLFQSWNDGNADNPRQVVVSSDTTFTTCFISDSTQTASITVVSNVAAMGTVSGGGTYEMGDSTIIAAAPYDGYNFTRWSDGNTQNPRRIKVSGDATYVANFGSVGIAETEADECRLYPNPTEGKVTLSCGAAELIEVYDEAGQRMATWQHTNETDLSNMAAGIYTLRIQAANGTVVRKVVKR